MAVADILEPRIITFDRDRRSPSTDGRTNLEQLIVEINSHVQELKRRNQDLEERNSELASALEKANERIALLERAAPANSERTRNAFGKVAEELARAEISTYSVDADARAEITSRYEEATRLALENQRQAIALLEKAREDAARRNREADRKAIAVLDEARGSILFMAESLKENEVNVPEFVSERPPRAGVAVEHTTASKDAGFDDVSYRLGQLSSQLSGMGGGASTAQTARARRFEPQYGRDEDQYRAGRPQLTVVEPVATEPEAAISTVELVASPFKTFASLNAFHSALRRLPGVKEVEAKEFNKGTFRAEIEYGDSSPLAGRLIDLPGFNLRFVSVEDRRIEVGIENN